MSEESESKTKPSEFFMGWGICMVVYCLLWMVIKSMVTYMYGADYWNKSGEVDSFARHFFFLAGLIITPLGIVVEAIVIVVLILIMLFTLIQPLLMELGV